MSDEEKDSAIIFGLGKHKDFRPPSWRYRRVERRMIEAHAKHEDAIAPHVMRYAPAGKLRRNARGHSLTPGVSPAVRTVKYKCWQHDGAEWLLEHDVRESIAPDAYNLRTFVPLKVKYALLDARRDETQGGLTGRHDGENRAPKHASPHSGFDSAASDAIDNGDYPLVRRSVDPMLEAARLEMQEHVRAAHKAWSKPTARARMRELYGPEEVGHACPKAARTGPRGWHCWATNCTRKPCREEGGKGWRPDVLGLNEPAAYRASEGYREPTGYRVDWAYREGGKGRRREGGKGRRREGGKGLWPCERVAGWPPSADSEFEDFGTVLDPGVWEPRTPIVGRRSYTLAAAWSDERVIEKPAVCKPLCFDGDGPPASHLVRHSPQFGLMDANERAALCASLEDNARKETRI